MSTMDTNQIGTYTVTYSVSDVANDAADVATRAVTMVDATPPDIAAEATGPLVTANLGTPIMDATDRVSKNLATTALAVSTHTIIWTTIDLSGNRDGTSQTVTMKDITPPTIAVDDANLKILEPRTSDAIPCVTATDLQSI